MLLLLHRSLLRQKEHREVSNRQGNAVQPNVSDGNDVHFPIYLVYLHYQRDLVVIESLQASCKFSRALYRQVHHQHRYAP